jgi:mannitol/fructose-specific phosphotransferase system IIA component (Ntr-type)
MPKPEPLLREDLILVPLPAATLAQALTVMIQRIEEVGLLRDPEALRKGIELSPERAAVPISPAVILPHYRTDSVERLVVALGISAEPLRTEQPDARVVALVLAPPDDTSTYLRAVSANSRCHLRCSRASRRSTGNIRSLCEASGQIDRPKGGDRRPVAVDEL